MSVRHKGLIQFSTRRKESCRVIEIKDSGINRRDSKVRIIEEAFTSFSTYLKKTYTCSFSITSFFILNASQMEMERSK